MIRMPASAATTGGPTNVARNNGLRILRLMLVIAVIACSGRTASSPGSTEFENAKNTPETAAVNTRDTTATIDASTNTPELCPIRGILPRLSRGLGRRGGLCGPEQDLLVAVHPRQALRDRPDPPAGGGAHEPEVVRPADRPQWRAVRVRQAVRAQH